MSSNPIHVLVVDDSVVTRGLLTRALQSDPEIIVSGSAGNGQTALNQLRKQHFDLVIMDVEMPILDGLETLKVMQQEFPKIPVVMASTLTKQGTATTIKALAIGAAGCIEKPKANSATEAIQLLAAQVIPLVKSLSGRKAARAPRPVTDLSSTSKNTSPSSPVHMRTREACLHKKPHVIVIGSSTGGPQALSRVMTQLSPKIQQPILVTQHMPAAFTPMLAEHIARDSKRPAKEAEDGETLQAGHIYVAPGNFHMYLQRQNLNVVVRLNQDPPEHYCRPSVNPLFRSAADVFGERVLAVMLTGMGEDGIEGTRQIYDRGGIVIAQDEATSVVWGMPGAVVKADLAHEVLPISEISHKISELAQQELIKV